jgi:hypothetical protein
MEGFILGDKEVFGQLGRRRAPMTVWSSSVSRIIMCFALILSSACASFPAFLFPTVTDERLEAFMFDEASKLLKVTENAHNTTLYKFFLANFPREDILGLSIGEHRIFISYELTRRAYEHNGYLWLFRHTLAHEIAHDVLGHSKNERASNINTVSRSPGIIEGRDLGLPPFISLRNYSLASELAADRKAIEYWQKIGWDCRILIELFREFLDQGYTGDPSHPTEKRLTQASSLCDSGPLHKGSRQVELKEK